MRAKTIGLWTVSLCLLLSATAVADRDDISGNPGYVDFRKMAFTRGNEPTVEVNISGSLLRLVSRAAQEDEPELANTINGLVAIRVEVYKLERGSSQEALDELSATVRKLQDDGWETIVRVRERDEQTYIATKTDGDAIVGLIVLSADEDSDEIALVNIVGRIDLNEVWRIGDQFDIDHLDSVRDAKKRPRSKKP